MIFRQLFPVFLHSLSLANPVSGLLFFFQSTSYPLYLALSVTKKSQQVKIRAAKMLSTRLLCDGLFLVWVNLQSLILRPSTGFFSFALHGFNNALYWKKQLPHASVKYPCKRWWLMMYQPFHFIGGWILRFLITENKKRTWHEWQLMWLSKRALAEMKIYVLQK